MADGMSAHWLAANERGDDYQQRAERAEAALEMVRSEIAAVVDILNAQQLLVTRVAQARRRLTALLADREETVR